MANVLVVDHDAALTGDLCRKIGRMGHYVRYAATLQQALEILMSEPWDAVLLEVDMPDGDGVGILPLLTKAPSVPEVIVMTARAAADAKHASEAISNGAWDFVRKDSDLEAVLQGLTNALRYREERQAIRPPETLRIDEIRGGSEAMRVCLDLLAQAVATEANVLITGETGTGKELLARAIHDSGPRKERDFVVVDCAALPETLIESILFGHEKGAFTGADRAHVGLFKQADGGTLFLDEVGELPLSHQKAFLRILQERRFRPVGARREVSSDFRLVAATNRDLEKMVQAGEFRKDLLFRLRSFLIIVPPLRERPEDIREIVEYHAERLCNQYGLPPKGFAPDFFDALASCDWPGNARELVNTVERVLTTARNEPTLYPRHLPTETRVKIALHSIAEEIAEMRPPDQAAQTAVGPAALAPVFGGIGGFPKLRDCIDAHEKRYLEQLLEFTRNNVMEASRVSGLSRARLYVHLKKHDLSPNRTPKDADEGETSED